MLLRNWKLPVVMEEIVADPDQAVRFAQKVTYPIVLKGLIPEKAHKTEHGLVELGIGDRTSLQEAFERLRHQLGGHGRILVQKQERCDYELIAGFLRDDHFGPCVMFGLGGILAELEPDVSFALAPLTEADARKPIGTLRNRKLVLGFSKMAPLDESAMAQLLVNLGNLGSIHPQIEQIDINPLLVFNGRPVAVDANIILK